MAHKTMTQWCQVQRTTMQESNHKKVMAFTAWSNFELYTTNPKNWRGYGSVLG